MTIRISAAQYRAKANTKRPKYGNRKVVVDGVKFDSRREARRWAELQQMERAGLIIRLMRQPTFVLAPGVLITGETRKRPNMRYSADFWYVDVTTGERIVEDVKSTPTAKSKEFRRVQHLMKALLGVDITVVK